MATDASHGQLLSTLEDEEEGEDPLKLQAKEQANGEFDHIFIFNNSKDLSQSLADKASLLLRM